MANAGVETKESFLAFEDSLVKEFGHPIKFGLTTEEDFDLFIITEMYQRDKNFTKHIQEALSVYMALKRVEFNL